MYSSSSGDVVKYSSGIFLLFHSSTFWDGHVREGLRIELPLPWISCHLKIIYNQIYYKTEICEVSIHANVLLYRCVNKLTAYRLDLATISSQLWDPLSLLSNEHQGLFLQG
jgi:hypothetical protein